MERWEDLRRRHGRDGAHTTVAAASAGSYHRSFSSSLLDAIYRSTDEGAATGTGGRHEREWSDVDAGKQPHRPTVAVEGSKRTTASAQINIPGHSRRVPADAMNDDLQPQRHQYRGGSCRIKQQQHQQRQGERIFTNSTSSSSDSSYGGFSSSDAEKGPAVLSATPRPRPIRTSCATPEVISRIKEKKPPKDSGAHKAEGSIGDRFRASKLYRELNKAKTPASPGARLASFLNTLFATARSTNKKAAKTAAGSAGWAAGGDVSLCSSSASSYSRSRLSRTPSSMGKAAPAGCPDARRPVRFFPVSFIVDDDCRPRGHRGAYAADQQKPAEYLTRRGYPPSARQVAEARRPTREATREFIRGYEERSSGSNGLPQGDERDDQCEAAEGDEDDGTASYSSSDLFELENLEAIGVAGGELPVYETTRLESDRGMAQGPGLRRKKIEIR